MEKLNIDPKISDTTCPCCKNEKNRFYIKFYYDKTFLRCEDCGFFQEI